MKRTLPIFLFLLLPTFLMTGCTKFLFEGESAPLNKKVISVSVTADPIPPVVKPLPPPPVDVPEKTQPRKLPKAVDQKLLPQELAPETPLAGILLEPSRPPGTNAYAGQSSAITAAPDNASAVYDGTVLNEDITWRGTILVKGFVVVSPQATLRIDPGTVVRFAGTGSKNGAARLVVQGRIQALGTSAKPILLTSGRTRAARGDWGGVSFVSSEKRNMLEHTRIEYADSGIEARFSSVSLKMVSITNSHTAILAHDAVVQATGASVSESETGIEAHDSELDIRDSSIYGCQRGMLMHRSSVGITSSRIKGNEQYGLQTEDCRVKIASGEISENGNGARFKGGEGQIQATRFTRNRETALQLSAARIKIQRCQFAENKRDAIRLEDGRALVSGNVFISNSGFNIYNAGREDVNAMLNWWGSVDQSLIAQKIHDAVSDPRSGSVQVFPWLKEKPPLMP